MNCNVYGLFWQLGVDYTLCRQYWTNTNMYVQLVIMQYNITYDLGLLKEM